MEVFFTKTPGRVYVDGKVSYVDLVDKDLFSVHELDAMMDEIGYKKPIPTFYHLKIPDLDLDYGLRALGNDSDVLTMLKHIRGKKEVEIYTEHWKSNVGTYLLIPSTSTVVIEELAEVIEEPKVKELPRKIDINSVAVNECDEGQVSEGDQGQVNEGDQGQVNEGDQGQLYEVHVNEGDHVDDLFLDLNLGMEDFDPFYDQGTTTNEGLSFDQGTTSKTVSEGISFDKGKTFHECTTVDESIPFDEGMAVGEVQEDECSEDGEFTLDASDMLDEVDVDMREQNESIVNINSEAVDMDDFESNSDDSDFEKERKTLLKRLRREHAPSSSTDIGCSFFVGQAFGAKEGIKGLID